MRVFFLGNNRLGAMVLRFLRSRDERVRNETVVGVVLHPPARRKFGSFLVEAAGQVPIVEGGRFDRPDHLERVATLRPDLAVSVMYGYIVSPEFLGLFPRGCVNLHLSLLPYNRGAHTNAWPIVDGTPAGVTLHLMDAGVDTGAVIAQREVPVEPVDTGRSLYRKLERAALDLFREHWPTVRDGRFRTVPQDPAAGTFHRVRDLESIDRIDLDATYKARDLINLLRARTFAPYPGAYFVEQGRRVHVRIQLRYGDHDAEGS